MCCCCRSCLLAPVDLRRCRHHCRSHRTRHYCPIASVSFSQRRCRPRAQTAQQLLCRSAQIQSLFLGLNFDFAPGMRVCFAESTRILWNSRPRCTSTVLFSVVVSGRCSGFWRGTFALGFCLKFCHGRFWDLPVPSSPPSASQVCLRCVSGSAFGRSLDWIVLCLRRFSWA